MNNDSVEEDSLFSTSSFYQVDMYRTQEAVPDALITHVAAGTGGFS